MKAMRKFATERVLTATSHSFLRVSWVSLANQLNLPLGRGKSQAGPNLANGAGAGTGKAWPPPSWSPRWWCGQRHFQSEPLVPSRHQGPLLLQNPQESSEGLSDILDIDSFPPVHKVGIDEALGIKGGQHHLLFPCGMDFGLEWPWVDLPQPLFGLLLGVSCLEGPCRLIHCDNIVQHGHQVMVKNH